MMRTILQPIFDKIQQYDTIFLFRHIRLDGDCVGSSKGLKRIIQLTWPEKKVYLIDSQRSDFLAFLGSDDEDVADEVYASGLGIVVDTATKERISNQKFRLCKELVKIDHHILVDDYAPTSWVEEDRSSACEMIATFYDTFRDQLKIDRLAATYIFTGMVTDSGRFRFRSVSGDTMRCAGLMLDAGVDTDIVFAHLYLKDFDYLKFKAHVYDQMRVTENGVAYIHVTKEMKDRFGLTQESASSVVSFLENIKGCLCWIAFIDQNDEENTIRVRLRSRFVPVNSVAENWRGGGHACACGATVYSQEEMDMLLAQADAHIRQYKESHEGWL